MTIRTHIHKHARSHSQWIQLTLIKYNYIESSINKSYASVSMCEKVKDGAEQRDRERTRMQRFGDSIERASSTFVWRQYAQFRSSYSDAKYSRDKGSARDFHAKKKKRIEEKLRVTEAASSFKQNGKHLDFADIKRHSIPVRFSNIFVFFCSLLHFLSLHCIQQFKLWLKFREG